MSRNLRPAERIVRLVIGVLIVGLYGVLAPPWRYVTLVGLLPLGTALTGYCPTYALLRRKRVR